MLHRKRSLPCATLRKIRSPQTIALDPDHAGSGSRHAMFSVFDQCSGRLLSTLTPFADGPRQFGQWSARAGATHESNTMVTTTTLVIRCPTWRSSLHPANTIELRHGPYDQAAVGNRRRGERELVERIFAEDLEFRSRLHHVGVAVLAE